MHESLLYCLDQCVALSKYLLNIQALKTVMGMPDVNYKEIIEYNQKKIRNSLKVMSKKLVR